MNDEIFEPLERFYYTLTSNNSRVRVNSGQSSQEVFIRDDDGKEFSLYVRQASSS